MPAAPAPDLLPYADARPLIRAGDVLLFRSRGVVASLIRWAGRSRYSHVGLAVWVYGRLMVAESRELRGCRLVPLSAAVGAAHVDLYQVQDVGEDSRSMVVAEALERLGAPYGWGSILRMAWSHLPLSLGVVSRLVRRFPLLRWLPKGRGYSEDDELPPGTHLVCSAYASACWRKAGVDLVRNLADSSTEPGDLARSTRLLMIGELQPEL